MAFLKVLLLAITLVLLPGCVDTSRSLSGEILEYHTGEYDALTALVIQTEEGETVGLLPEEGYEYLTAVWLGTGSVSEFRQEHPDTVFIQADCQRKKHTLTRADGTQIPAYVAEFASVTDWVEQREAVTFPDGVTADLWGGRNGHSYRLSDETELLRVNDSYGPDNSYVVNHESFDDLSTQAQEKVLAFYEAQGILYDEQETLELAYSYYQDDPENFGTLWLQQDISPYDSNEHMFTFVTSVSLPADDGQLYLLQLYHNFDRMTGESISSFDCFTLPPEEFLPVLLAQTNYQDWDNSPSLDEMLTYLRPEYIGLDRDSIYLDFPYGVLPSQEFSFGIGISYTAEVLDILHPWARPTT